LVRLSVFLDHQLGWLARHLVPPFDDLGTLLFNHARKRRIAAVAGHPANA
jgi:hypothetical protein